MNICEYGLWKSPISALDLVQTSVGLAEISVCNKDLWWLERRPEEEGRSTIVGRLHSEEGMINFELPAPWNIRSRVHEYGGAATLIAHDPVLGRIVIASQFSDGRLWCFPVPGSNLGFSEPIPLTKESQQRFSCLVLDRKHRRIIAVAEDHSSKEPTNSLVAIELTALFEQTQPQAVSTVTLAAGWDFYAEPQLSPDGKHLAWLTWHHPNMPWDATSLWLADVLEDGTLSSPKRVAGGESESITEPRWSPSGLLSFCSDKSGWWNLYCCDPKSPQAIKAIYPMPAEFSDALWELGMQHYVWLSESALAGLYFHEGSWNIGLFDNVGIGNETTLKKIPSTLTSVFQIDGDSNQLMLCGASETRFPTLITIDLLSLEEKVIRNSAGFSINPLDISPAKEVSFASVLGTSHAYYYPPKNHHYQAPDGSLPPLIVMSHGGPTSAASSALSLRTQYWTTRGFAVVDVNYGGSTGYGREYRRRLNKGWGITDLDDCIAAAEHLVSRELAHPKKLAIRGGSAGGYTTLAALTFRDYFHVGVSYFGVSDLEALARDTHKFESRYLDGLIGPYPQAQNTYIERSPINATEQLTCPVLFLQGMEDRVVPPNQAELMAQVLTDKGLPVGLITYEGEGHGFRKAENIVHSIESECYFYRRVFGLCTENRTELFEIINDDRLQRSEPPTPQEQTLL